MYGGEGPSSRTLPTVEEQKLHRQSEYEPPGPGEEIEMGICEPSEHIEIWQQERCQAAFECAIATFDGKVQAYNPAEVDDQGNANLMMLSYLEKLTHGNFRKDVYKSVKSAKEHSWPPKNLILQACAMTFILQISTSRSFQAKLVRFFLQQGPR